MPCISEHRRGQHKPRRKSTLYLHLIISYFRDMSQSRYTSAIIASNVKLIQMLVQWLVLANNKGNTEFKFKMALL